jgi:lysophospholipase-3
MLELTKSLLAHGYSRDMSLRAATYDFRVAGAPRQTQQQFAHLKAFIEKASRDNGAKPVHLLSHSLGGPVTNQFLILQSPVWKKQYIASHIMLSAPLLGTPVALQSLISGPMYDFVPQMLPSLLTPVLRTLPSMLWMFPREPANSDRTVWSSLPSFIQTPNANISTDNTEKLLSMLDATMLSKLQPFVNTIVANSMDDPGVKVLCMFANDTATNMNVHYSGDHFKGGKVVDKGLGDGTVPLQSLRWCSEWADTTMVEFEIGGALSSHTDIVKKSEIISAVISWVTQRVDELPLLV